MRAQHTVVYEWVHGTAWNIKLSLPPSKVVVHRVFGLIFAAERQLQLEVVVSGEMEAFVDCCGGSLDKSKTEYIIFL